MIMGLLPCMIPAWVLGLAASTQSPLHGALLMVILVWMTSGVIFGFGLAPAAILARRRAGRALVPSMLVLSGCWLGLVAAAANGWIGHASLGFTAGNSGYAMMFW
jgi:sulfite exporter TauE/SafE